MNRARWILIILISALCAWWLLKNNQTPPAEPSSDPAVEETAKPIKPKETSIAKRVELKPSLNNTSSLVKERAAPKLSPPVAAQSKAASSDPHKPPPDTVPFELINGYVVAYGDVLLGKPTREDFPKAGFIERPKLKTWESTRIPFSIHADIQDPERILRVIAYFNQFTPIKFVPYNGEPDNIVFMPFRDLCLSYLGKVGGNQPIYLDDRCGDAEISHEIMHALGFVHEHSRADRDQYLRVNWNNIERDRESQFMVTPPELNEPLQGRPFDHNSVMIYPPNMFALDRARPVLESISGTPIDPVRQGLSPEDILRLRLFYGK